MAAGGRKPPHREWRIWILFVTGVLFAGYLLVTSEGRDLPTNWMLLILGFVGVVPMVGGAINQLMQQQNRKDQESDEERIELDRRDVGRKDVSGPGNARVDVAWVCDVRRWRDLRRRPGHGGGVICRPA